MSCSLKWQFFSAAALLLVLLCSPVTAGDQTRQLSSASWLGYYPFRNPRTASWYLSKFAANFSAFLYMGVPVGNLTAAVAANALAERYGQVPFYVQLIVPSEFDPFNETQLLQVERELGQQLKALNASNVKGVELSALYEGQWVIPWVKRPPADELEAWYSWLAQRGLPRVPFAQNGTVYTPLFAQWAVYSAAHLAGELLNYSRSTRPSLEYGLIQFDSVAEDDDSVQSLYEFCSVARPDFVVTEDLGLAEPVPGYASYPYAFLLISLPMAPEYAHSFNCALLVDDSFAGITSGSGDTVGMALFKFTLNEVTTYLSGATPLVDTAFFGPHGDYVPLQEFVLDPALQIRLSSLPSPSFSPAEVLVIRPTYSIGDVNVTASYQQQLINSLARMGVPFDYVSEAFVYSHPSVLTGYKYVIYASNQITPQMAYILSQDNSSIKVGLSSTYFGYIYSDLPQLHTLPFNKVVQSYNLTELSFLGKPLPSGSFTLYYGRNAVSWNSTGLYVDGRQVRVAARDYLGLMQSWFTLFHVAEVLVVLGVIFLSAVIYQNRRRSREIRRILKERKASAGGEDL